MKPVSAVEVFSQLVITENLGKLDICSKNVFQLIPKITESLNFVLTFVC